MLIRGEIREKGEGGMYALVQLTVGYFDFFYQGPKVIGASLTVHDFLKNLCVGIAILFRIYIDVILVKLLSVCIGAINFLFSKTNIVGCFISTFTLI